MAENWVLHKEYFGIERRDWFLAIVFLTILFSRFILYLLPSNFFIFHDDLHHLHYGLLLLFVVIVMDRKWHYRKILIPFSIAMGLIVDELIFVLPGIYGAGKELYFSFPSFFGMFFMVFLVFVFRDKILKGLDALVN